MFIDFSKILMDFAACPRYLLDDRELQIEWQYATKPGGQAGHGNADPLNLWDLAKSG